MLTLVPSPGEEFPLGCRGAPAHLLPQPPRLTDGAFHTTPLTFPELNCVNKQMRLLALPLLWSQMALRSSLHSAAHTLLP